MEKYIQEQQAILEKKILPQTKKEDFEAFWTDAVAKLRQVPLQVTREKLVTPYDNTFTTYLLRYNTHDDTGIDAYFSFPTGATEKLPCVISYHGGSLKKELLTDILSTGVCCLSMDVRGQGGTTIDRAVYNSGCTNSGLMTKGVLDQNEFYLKNVYLDAVRAVDVAATLPEVDPGKIIACGGSQGGALSIAASALSGKVKKCYSYVTSICCLKQRTELGSRIFGSTHEFLKTYPQYTDRVFDVLTYFDTVNMVSLLKVPTSFSLCLEDPVCLPHFVYTAYHYAPCEKTMDIYPFMQHHTHPAYRWKMHGEFAAMVNKEEL